MTATGDMLAVAPATPTRTCIGCRATRAQTRLLRFARRDDGHVVPINVTRGISGRTAYTCPQRSCLDQALKRRAFMRAFGSGRQRLSVIDVDPNGLWAATADQLRREIDLLGRSSENPHAHPRRRGLEQLLSELSSPPKPLGAAKTTQSSAAQSCMHSNTSPQTPRGGPNHG